MISSNHLDPGSVGKIKASVNTTGRGGPLVKHITVFSNDRRNPALSLSLSMDVVQK